VNDQWISTLKFDQAGLCPVIVTDATTGQLLMLAYANREALALTLATQQAWFFSRSRHALWKKGESSGNTLCLRSITLDCDRDTVRYEVLPSGPTCHTGAYSCFFDRVWGDSEREQGNMLRELDRVIAQRKREMPAGSYTAKLLQDGIPKIARKIGEESTEVILASLNESPERLVSEVADLWYHSLVLLAARGKSLDDVMNELSGRRN